MAGDSKPTMFDAWWSRRGQFIDPDTSDVPWHDKRKALAEAAFDAAMAQSGNYVADAEVSPRCVTFANGRVVTVGHDGASLDVGRAQEPVASKCTCAYDRDSTGLGQDPGCLEHGIDASPDPLASPPQSPGYAIDSVRVAPPSVGRLPPGLTFEAPIDEEHPIVASETPKVNVCEHGDHPAPPGQRFCSDACAHCETSTCREGQECAGICGRASETPEGGGADDRTDANIAGLARALRELAKAKPVDWVTKNTNRLYTEAADAIDGLLNRLASPPPASPEVSASGQEPWEEALEDKLCASSPAEVLSVIRSVCGWIADYCAACGKYADFHKGRVCPCFRSAVASPEVAQLREALTMLSDLVAKVRRHMIGMRMPSNLERAVMWASMLAESDDAIGQARAALAKASPSHAAPADRIASPTPHKPLTEAEEAAMRPVPGGGLSSSWASRVFATLDAARARMARLERAVRELIERAEVVSLNIEDAGDEGDAVSLMRDAIEAARAALAETETK